MSRPAAVFAIFITLIVGAVAGAFLNNPSASLQEADVRAIVSEMLAVEAVAAPEQNMSVAQIDPATIHPMIESYLLANPRILERVSNALQAEIRAEETARTRVALAEMQEPIYKDPDNVVLGNPDGDVTLVEMFDYNCGYCRSALPDMISLLEDDPNLRIILKEFPILSEDSVDAAKVAVAAQKSGVDYLEFHTQLFTGRGRVNKQAALDAAAAQGLNPVSLELMAQGDDVNAVIQRSYKIAQAVGATGTPAYIIGDTVIPGAIGIDGLKQLIGNMRTCGSTDCEG